MTCNFLIPNWPQPKNIRAYSTTRLGGVSKGAYASLNLGIHVSDSEENVLKNRSILQQDLIKGVLGSPCWLNQTHSTICVDLDKTHDNNADAAITTNIGKVLVVMTADCLPILLCAKNGQEIAAIHAGWRGLCNGIIENTLAKMQTPKNEIMAWFGPAICGNCYEVGQDVYDLFMMYAQQLDFRRDAKEKHDSAGLVKYNNKWLLNTQTIAKNILKAHNVNAIYSCERCTFEEEELFFSYRRNINSQTGRMATLIWME